MGGDAVEEPAVVRDDHHAAAEVLEALFERAESGDVEVVGGFVEEQQVAAGGQELREVHTVALAAGEHADLLLLFRAAEVEARAVGASVHHRRSGKADEFAAACYGFVDGLIRLELAAGLVHIAELHGVADGECAGDGLELSGNELEESGLASAIRADHADNSAAR